MKLQTLSRSVGAKGRTRGWRVGLLPLILLVTGLSSRAEAAGSTASIDVAQFAPDSLLTQYSVYATDSINLPNQSGTANGGYFGSGGGISLANNIKMRSDLYTAGRNFSLADGSGADSGKFVVTGNFDVGNNAIFDSVLQVGGKLITNGNDVRFNNSIYTKDLSVKGDRTNFYGSINVTGTFWANSNKTILHGAAVNMAGVAGTVIDPPSGMTPNYGATIVPPLGKPLIRLPQDLPGYNVVGLDLAGNPTRQSFNVGSNFVGGNNGHPVTLKNTATGASAQNVFDCVTDFTQRFGAAVAASSCHGDTLQPGYYGDLTFNSANGEVLLLGEGFYYFDKISLGSSGKIVASQPNGKRTFVYSQQDMIAQGSNSLISPEGAINATKYGAGTGSFLGGTMMLLGGANVTIPNDNTIWATISAPRGDVHLGSQVKVFGQVFAKRIFGDNNIDFGEGAYIPFDPKTPRIRISIASTGIAVPEADFTYYAKLTLSKANAFPVSFSYVISDTMITKIDSLHHAVGDVNYVSKTTPSTVTIAAGDTSVLVPFTVKWDHVYTGDNNFYLHFSVPQNGVFELGTGVVGDSNNVFALVTILDKDRAPTLRISDVSASEGNSGKTPFVFTVSFADSVGGGVYAGTVNRDITFKWSTKDSTADSATGDFSAVTNQTATITKGSTSTTLTVSVNGDLRYEPTEYFKVVIDSISLVGQAAIASPAKKDLVGIGTIVNDDNFPKLMIDSAGFKEGDADSVRKLVVYLVDPVTKAKLDVTSAPEVPVKYSWSTSDNTAGHSLTGTIPDTDYVEVPSSARSIAANKWTDTIQVTTKGDARFEANETFRTTLVPGDSAWKKDGNTVALDTIRNDDNQPIVKVRDASVVEGNSDTTKLYFKVGLYSQATRLPMTKAELPTTDVTFDWKTTAGTATDAGTYKDYTAVTGAKGTITAGSADTLLWVDVIGDKRYEADEQFTVELSKLTNAALYPLNDTVATMTIRNDDALPVLGLSADATNSIVKEGDPGDRKALTFTLSLLDAAGKPLSVADGPELPVTFSWQTVDGTAKTTGLGIADTDYVAEPSQAGVFNVGTVSQKLTVQLKGDRVDEDDETFTVSANAVSGATGTVTAVGKIPDDDGAPVLHMVGTDTLEGNSGTTMFRTRLWLSSPSALPVSFDWSTLPLAGGAAPGTDFQSMTGTFKIQPGVKDTFLTVAVNGDRTLENDEAFAVQVSNPKNVTWTLGTDTAWNVIRNDDALPFIRVGNADPVKERNVGAVPDTLRFVVSLVDSSGKPAVPSDLPVSYTWSTVDSVDNVGYTGASSADNDFVKVTAAPRTIDRRLTDTLKVVVTPDNKYEKPESFRVVLASVTNADPSPLGQGVTSAVGTILNDDDMPKLSVADASVKEPATPIDPDTKLDFVLTLDQPSGVPVKVSYQSEGLTATPDDDLGTPPTRYDYKDVKSSVTFAPGEVSKTASVPVHGDNIYERTVDETLNLKLSSPSEATVSRGTALGSIKDNDDAPVLHVDTQTVSEGAVANFTVSLRDLSGNPIVSGLPVNFSWRTVNGTATAPGDYVAVLPTVATIPALTNSIQVQVATKADNLANEGVETFKLVLSAPVNAVLGDTGLGRIVDATPKPLVSINDTVVGEADGNAVFTVRLTNPSDIDLVLAWGTLTDMDKAPLLRARSSGTDSNYKPQTGRTLTIPAGSLSATVSVPVNDNSLDEPDTLFYWTVLGKSLANDTAFGFKDSLGVGGIRDNDAPPTIGITDTTVMEPANQASPPTRARFYVKLSAPSAYEVTGTWKTVDGTATSASSSTASPDFTAASGTFKIPAGQIADSVFVDVLGDTLDENSETFQVKLLTSVNAPVSATDSAGIGTILDEDPLPSIYVRDTAVNEPANGSAKTYKLFAYLNRRSAKPVTVAWATADNGGANTATAGADYYAASGTLTFAPGDTVKTMDVTVIGDGVGNEGRELFKVSLSGLTNVLAGRAVAVDTIIDADDKPFATIDPVTVVEPMADSTVLFTVRLDKPSATVVTISYATIDITATAGADYVAAGGNLDIPAGSLTGTIPVTVKADLIHEDTETFQVKLLASASASFSEKIGLGTIVDNDSKPTVAVSDASKLEPAAPGASDTMTFRIALSAPSGLPVTVKWGTRPGTAQDTAQPYDYQDTGSTLVFAPGRTDTTIGVRIYGDSLYEGPERFFVVLSEPDGAFFVSNDSTGIGTILDQDTAPRISIDDRTVREGDTARFTVRLERESGLATTFSWNTVDGTAKASLGDYKDTSGAITIPAGQLSAGIDVRSLADNVSGEGAETFLVALKDISGASIGRDTGTGTILDTNSLPRLSIGDVLHVREADTLVGFVVTLSGAPSAVPVHVHYTTHEGTAAAGVRFVDTAGTVTIPAGATSVTIPVHILNDNIREPDEEFFTVVLDGADSARIAQPVGTGGVVDDGDFPILRVGNSERTTEGDDALFPFELVGSSKDTIRVWWHTADSTAKMASDYVAASGKVTFLPGRRQSSVSVATVRDNVWEPDEYFRIVIDSAYGVGGKDSTAVGTIVDFGGIPTIRFLSPDTAVREDAADSVVVRIGLSRPASVDIEAIVADMPGTATFGLIQQPGIDYTVLGRNASKRVVFKAGDTVATFAVRVFKDSTDEYDEVANFQLQPIFPITLGGKHEYALTILDDDSAPAVGFVKAFQEIREGDSVVVTAHLSRPSGKDAQAWYRSGGTATPGVDDDRVPGAHMVFVFKAGDTAASVTVRTVDDNIFEGQEGMLFRLDSLVNLTPDAAHDRDSVNVLDNDNVPVVSFRSLDTTVREDVGTVVLGLRLSNPSSVSMAVFVDAHAGTATLDSAARVSDALLGNGARYLVTIPAGDTAASFSFKVLDDGRVEPTESFSLRIASKDAKPADPDSLRVHILDNDLPPVVKITSPPEGAALGKKDLNAAGKVPATWSVNSVAMAPFDTLLREGPSTIVKSYTDEWGNVGVDSVHVTLDTTPPVVVIDSVCKRNGVCVPAGPTMPWVNDPDVTLKWHYVDGPMVVTRSDKEHLSDSVNSPIRFASDAVGNWGSGTAKVGLDTVAPTVDILTPPSGSHWAPGCLNVTYTTQDNDVIKLHDTLQCFPTIGKHTYTVCSEADRAGNVGCDTSTVFIDPMVPSSATYLDTDGDGRIDQVVVNFPAKWVGELPTADISYGTPGTNTVKGVKATYGSSSQAGSFLVTGKDTLKDASGKPVRVVPGVAVLDAKGQQVVDANGVPVYQSSLGTPLLDAKGVQRLDSNGVPLWSVSSSSSAVDSSVLVFKLTTPYPYGWTSSSVKDLGVLHAISLVKDTTGAVVKQPYSATFNINDGVAPAILRSEIHRTECYTCKDTTIIYPSEPLSFSKTKGTGIVQISTDGGLSWHDVTVDSLTPSGAIVVLTEPGAPGSPKPNVLIRLVDAVSDMKGNVATTGHQPSVLITGGPRPDLVEVKAPTGVLEVDAGNASKNLKGGFTFLTSRKDTTNLTAYRPGEGYGTAAETQEVCPDVRQCSVTRLYINRPASVHMYVYDHIGTYIAKTSFTVSKKDMEMMETDKLDRARLDVLWNLRNDQGRQVVSGVYLIRMIIRYNDANTADAPLENFVLKIGVHIND